MRKKACYSAIIALLISLSLSLFAAERKKAGNDNPSESGPPSYELPEPVKETIDYTMYHRIRDEGLGHSHVMEYASALIDGIGPRLTGSPNLKRANDWTRDQFTAMGCSNSHLEDWGEFGMGWQQLNTWVRMSSPDTAVLIAQAAPWSASSNGPVNGPVFWMNPKKVEDLEKYKGKLAGKIVLLGDMREVKPVDKPLFTRMDEKALAKEVEYPLPPQEEYSEYMRNFPQRQELREKIVQLLASEHALAVITPSQSQAGESPGGTGGTIFDENNLVWPAYMKEHAVPFPVVVMAIENYGRVYRLLEAHVPVTIEMNVDTKFTGDHEHGFDTIAEITGTDPKLKDEIVMLGAHLDSWAAATGATDNGAGTVVSMEVMRILNALQVKPRRTIRVGLWTGEEQCECGSSLYVKEHFGYVPLSTAPDQLKLPVWFRKPTGPVELKPTQQKISGYFNVDNGTGKILGIYLEQNAAIAPVFAQWIEPLKDLGVTTITMRGTEGTDHESFDAVGIPAFQFIQDEMDYETLTHHSNMDTYERLQEGDLAQAATVEAIFVYNTAMRDQMLPRKPLPHPELEEKRKAPLKRLMPEAEEADEKDAKPD